MRRHAIWTVVPVLLLCGCVSPYAHMEQYDLKWYAEDRFAYADEMPARDKEEGFKKVQAYWESIEAIRHVEDPEAALLIDGRQMTRDEARRLVRERIKETHKTVGITEADYCGRAVVWTALIPYRIIKTPVDWALMLAESPFTNIEW